MKSNPKQLESRGFVTEGAENAYLTTTLEQRLAMLKKQRTYHPNAWGEVAS